MNNLSIWHFIIIASILYAAYSILRFLAKAIRSRSPNAELKESELVINAYGKMLAQQAPLPGTVADESKLPYPKSHIKKAILYGLNASDKPTNRQVLKAAYLQLADFQAGVGAKNVGLDLSSINVSSLTQAELLAMADNIASSQDVITTAKAESERLTAELAAAGY